MLTLKDEWTYIWANARFDLVRIVFFINRYSNEVALLYVAYGESVVYHSMILCSMTYRDAVLVGFHGAFTPSVSPKSYYYYHFSMMLNHVPRL